MFQALTPIIMQLQLELLVLINRIYYHPLLLLCWNLFMCIVRYLPYIHMNQFQLNNKS